MNKKSYIPRIVCLLVMSFFLVEYFEPSAIGIRAGNFNIPSETQSEKSPNQENHSNSKGFLLFTPHAMINVEPYYFDEKFPEFFLPFLTRSLAEKIFSIEISHPPA